MEEGGEGVRRERGREENGKVQHYDGYALKTGNAGGRLAVFDDAQLPAGIKRAFADLCTKVVEGCTWHTAC